MQAAYFSGWFGAAFGRRSSVEDSLALPVYSTLPSRVGGAAAAALTIDDGPTDASVDLLQILNDYGAKASFFLVGARAEKKLNLIERILADGHDVYGHSWSHRRLDCMSEWELQDEMESTEALLRKFRGTPTPYFVRLPFGAGAYDSYVHGALHGWNQHSKILQWNVTLRDWEIGTGISDAESVDRQCAELAEKLLTRERLSGAIVLTHDEALGVDQPLARRVSTQALRHVLDKLQTAAVRVIPVSSALGAA
jgi:peptidoglycan/xylan/chitin deacetylase (PgdA/CDA1 family)